MIIIIYNLTFGSQNTYTVITGRSFKISKKMKKENMEKELKYMFYFVLDSKFSIIYSILTLTTKQFFLYIFNTYHRLYYIFFLTIFITLSLNI